MRTEAARLVRFAPQLCTTPMRQTLLRLSFDDLFGIRTAPSTEAAPFHGWGPGLFVGVGWLLLPWMLVMLLWALSVRNGRRRGAAPPDTPWGLLAFPVILLVGVPLLRGLLPASVPVYGWGFAVFLAFVLGGIDASRRARSQGIPDETLWDLGMIMFFAGIIGCRVFHLVQYWDKNFGDKNTLGEMLFQAVNLSNGGMVLYGGVIAGLITYLVFCYRRKLNPLAMADVVVPSCLLGIGIGRLGCFLNGCCYGDFCALPWAVRFPEDSVPFQSMIHDGILVPGYGIQLWLHPAQIYSAFNAFLLYLVLRAYYPVRSRDGAVLGLGLLTYPVTRFLLEFVRSDEPGRFETSLTISQWVSLGVFAAGIVFAIWQWKRGPQKLDSQPAQAA